MDVGGMVLSIVKSVETGIINEREDPLARIRGRPPADNDSSAIAFNQLLEVGEEDYIADSQKSNW